MLRILENILPRPVLLKIKYCSLWNSLQKTAHISLSNGVSLFTVIESGQMGLCHSADVNAVISLVDEKCSLLSCS